MEQKKNLTQKDIVIIGAVLLAMITLTFVTKYQGGNDVLDYANVAKFFAGDLNAKIRTSHSYLYGFIHAPFVGITQSFLIFKFTSLALLFGIVYSVYVLSDRNKYALWLILVAPIMWYMAPWTSPIQAASLCFIWGYYWAKKYGVSNKLRELIYAGLCIGLGLAFWDPIVFFGVFLLIPVLYSTRVWHAAMAVLAVMIGMLPRLALDQYLFNFAFFNSVKYSIAFFAHFLFGGFYGGASDGGLARFVMVLLFFPIYTYVLFKKEHRKKNVSLLVLLALSGITFIFNAQVRFALVLVPITLAVLTPLLSKKQVIIQGAIFACLTLIVINPYILQISHDTNVIDVDAAMNHFGSIYIREGFLREEVRQDLEIITEQYPGEVFLAGNRDDTYAVFANLYWGDGVEEFVSVQDYNLEVEGNPDIFSKEYCTSANIAYRREICAEMSIKKTTDDTTDYGAIRYAISEEPSLDVEGFELVESYTQLHLFRKIETE